MKVVDFSYKFNELIEELETSLPKTDIPHRDEILDIAYLLQRRIEMYTNEYGWNE